MATHAIPEFWPPGRLYSGQILENFRGHAISVVCSNGTLGVTSDSGGTVGNATLPPLEAWETLIYKIDTVLLLGDASRPQDMPPPTGSVELQSNVYCDGTPWPVDSGVGPLRQGIAALAIAVATALLQ